MSYLLILLAVSLAVSAVGWKYFVYFFSLGYGFGIAALAITIAILFSGALSAPTFVLCLLLVCFGCRLGGYLLIRERKAAAYRKILYDPSVKKEKPVGVMLAVWIFCALLYVGQVSPVAFRLANTADGAAVSDLWAWIGAAVMAAGHCGVGLGQTPNAVANMAAVIDKNGPAPTAWFVLPVVTVIFINIMNPIIITTFINLLA